jgi:hypothetical protein
LFLWIGSYGFVGLLSGGVTRGVCLFGLKNICSSMSGWERFVLRMWLLEAEWMATIEGAVGGFRTGWIIFPVI